MKKCYKCAIFKENSEFAKHSKRSDGLQPVCRECKKIMDNYYYKTHTPQMKKQILESKRKRIRQIQNKVFEYLSSHPCVDCGENDIVVLEFDHERDKKENISVMVNAGLSWDQIMEEVKKCQVRCANCHRRKTAKAFSYRRYTLSESLAQR